MTYKFGKRVRKFFGGHFFLYFGAVKENDNCTRIIIEYKSIIFHDSVPRSVSAFDSCVRKC